MRIVFFIFILMVFFAFRNEAGAQLSGVGASIDVEKIDHRIVAFRGAVFSAKFLCGTIPHNPEFPQLPIGGDFLVPGSYLTAINIYNPNNFQVRFAKKAVQTLSQRDELGRVSNQVIEILPPMRGLEIDCCDIAVLFGKNCEELVLGQGFAKGFVDIAINPFVPLEVVGVYTLKNVLPEPGP